MFRISRFRIGKKAGRPGLITVLCGSVVALLLLAGISGLPTSVSATSTDESTADLAAVRFVIVTPSDATASTAMPAPAFEIWVDGRRRVGGLNSALPSPFLLLSPGDRSIDVRSGDVSAFSTELKVASGSSTTFVLTGSSAGPKLIEIPDVSDRDGEVSLRMVNLTDTPVDALIGTTAVSIGAHEVAPATVANAAGTPTFTIGKKSVTVDQREPGAKVVLLRSFDPKAGPVVSYMPADRYPLASLHMGNLLATGSAAEAGRAPEYWLRLILSGFVVVLVVAATLATLKSFRTQALESRVRARME